MTKTLAQIREREAFDRGYKTAQRDAMDVCLDEQAIASAQHNLTIDGMAHGAERCRKRIEKLGTPQGHEGVSP